MTKYRLIGSAITGSDGKATITYTGSGKGYVDIVASTDSTITSDSLLSNEIEVLDCTFYDEATSTNHNDNWSESNITLTRGNQYSTISQTDTTIVSFHTKNFTVPCIVEFDMLVSDNTNSAISIRNESLNILQPPLSNLGILADTWYHIKLEITENTVLWYINTVLTRTDNISDIPTKILLRLENGSRISYKNYEIYPI